MASPQTPCRHDLNAVAMRRNANCNEMSGLWCGEIPGTVYLFTFSHPQASALEWRCFDSDVLKHPPSFPFRNPQYRQHLIQQHPGQCLWWIAYSKGTERLNNSPSVPFFCLKANRLIATPLPSLAIPPSSCCRPGYSLSDQYEYPSVLLALIHAR